jgi:type II secretory pathway pseudopilin PulG
MRLLLSRRRITRGGEDGYVLLFLLLTVALMVIAAAAVVPTIRFEIERDREEELIHRGVQYSRAIRAYYKKFGRYPAKIEDLENSNNLRFLRKRYKDPITRQDFKLLHFGEVKLTFSGGIGGGTIPGANPAGSTGLNPDSPLGQTQQSVQNSQANNPTPGLDNTGGSSTPGTPGASESGDNSGGSHDQLAGTTFGGGPIVGVVSASKKTGYREFNHKKKYSEWQFIYDPATDRGGLLMTPNQPQLQGFGQPGQQNLNGQNNGNNSAGTGSFGTFPSGVQNNPSSPSGGPGTPNQPENQQ